MVLWSHLSLMLPYSNKTKSLKLVLITSKQHLLALMKHCERPGPEPLHTNSLRPAAMLPTQILNHRWSPRQDPPGGSQAVFAREELAAAGYPSGAPTIAHPGIDEQRRDAPLLPAPTAHTYLVSPANTCGFSSFRCCWSTPPIPRFFILDLHPANVHHHLARHHEPRVDRIGC